MNNQAFRPQPVACACVASQPRSLALLFATALLCAAMLFAQSAFAQELPASGAVTGKVGEQLIKNLGEKLTVLDVRSPAEFAQGHIPNALLIPLQELDARIESIPTDKPVLIVCRTGRRAQIAYEHLQQARPEQALWFLASTPQYNSDNTYSLH